MDESRYSRQLCCMEGFDQSVLSGATILIVGMGGLGCTVSMALTAAGIGTLVLCDHDSVSLSNLNRQFLYRENDIGKQKVHLAVERLKKLNQEPDFIALDGKFHESLLSEHVQPQLIVDCLDNFAARLELVAYAARSNIPLVHGAVDGFMGQFSVFLPGKSGCPFCGMPDDVEPGNCDFSTQTTPSLGACVSIIAGLQATEAIKYFIDSSELCDGKLNFFDGLAAVIDTVHLVKDNNCIACSG